MKVNILTVGKLKNKNIISLVEHYTKRLKTPYLIAFKHVKISKAGNTKKAKNEEGLALTSAIRKDFSENKGKDLLIALDEKGEHLTSIGFADLIQRYLEKGKNIHFVIGGAAGLSLDLLDSADRNISLSKMTMPHDLALLTLVEQIYRAMTIEKGIPYHKT